MKAYVIERSDLINRTLNRYYHCFSDKVYRFEYCTLFDVDFGNWKEAKEVRVIKQLFDNWIRSGDWDLFNSVIKNDEKNKEEKKEVSRPTYVQARLDYPMLRELG